MLLYSNVRERSTLLNQDVPHGFDLFVSIIWACCCCISTRVGVIGIPSSTKPDSGVTACTILLFVSKNTNSRFWMAFTTGDVEAFLITVGLQGSLWTNQRLPRITTQWRSAVFSVSDQRVQGDGLFLDDKELDLLTDLHTEADLGEGCVPVGRQLGLLIVKPSLASWKVVGIFFAPKPSIVVEGFLKVKQESGLALNTSITFAKIVDRIKLHTFLPSIFIASVHPPSPHPKFPMWQ